MYNLVKCGQHSRKVKNGGEILRGWAIELNVYFRCLEGPGFGRILEENLSLEVAMAIVHHDRV